MGSESQENVDKTTKTGKRAQDRQNHMIVETCPLWLNVLALVLVLRAARSPLVLLLWLAALAGRNWPRPPRLQPLQVIPEPTTPSSSSEDAR
jgi:hypothetical protein